MEHPYQLWQFFSILLAIVVIYLCAKVVKNDNSRSPKTLQFSPCLDIICAHLREQIAHESLLNLSIVCKSIYKLTQPTISKYFHLRILDLPVERHTITSVIIFGQTTPSKESLLRSPAVTHVRWINYSEVSEIPLSVTHLHLCSLIPVSLSPRFLPFGLTRLRFSHDFNDHVGKDNLPSTLTHIFFGCYFDHPADDLPDSITHIKFGLGFDHPVDKLPPRLLFLMMGRNSTGADSLPKTLKWLCVNECYPSLSSYPRSITHLSIAKLTAEVSDTFPPKLQSLQLGTVKSEYLPPFPPTLTQFTIQYGTATRYMHGQFPDSLVDFRTDEGADFNLSQLSSRITTLSLWRNMEEPLSNLSKFACLTSLTLSYHFNEPIDGKLPPQLTRLTVGGNFNHPVDNLPPNLCQLFLGYYFNHPINNLPCGLVVLNITGTAFNQTITSLPDTLQTLVLCAFTLKIRNLNFIPANLQYLFLCIAGYRKATIGNNLPLSLTHLILEAADDQRPLTIVSLPPNLEDLQLRFNYNPPNLSAMLPAKLRHLSLGSDFNQPLTSLPPSLVTLHFNNAEYSHPLPTLPPTLRRFSPKYVLWKNYHPANLPPRLSHFRKCYEHSREWHGRRCWCDNRARLGDIDVLDEDTDEGWTKVLQSFIYMY